MLLTALLDLYHCGRTAAPYIGQPPYSYENIRQEALELANKMGDKFLDDYDMIMAGCSL